MATFCSLKIVAAMTKMARVPSSMQKLVFFKKFCRGPSGAPQKFFITRNIISQCVTPNFYEKSSTFLFCPTKFKLSPLWSLILHFYSAGFNLNIWQVKWSHKSLSSISLHSSQEFLGSYLFSVLYASTGLFNSQQLFNESNLINQAIYTRLI